jgi:hypothetical protein
MEWLGLTSSHLLKNVAIESKYKRSARNNFNVFEQFMCLLLFWTVFLSLLWSGGVNTHIRPKSQTDWSLLSATVIANVDRYDYLLISFIRLWLKRVLPPTIGCFYNITCCGWPNKAKSGKKMFSRSNAVEKKGCQAANCSTLVFLEINVIRMRAYSYTSLSNIILKCFWANAQSSRAGYNCAHQASCHMCFQTVQTSLNLERVFVLFRQPISRGIEQLPAWLA